MRKWCGAKEGPWRTDRIIFVMLGFYQISDNLRSECSCRESKLYLTRLSALEGQSSILPRMIRNYIPLYRQWRSGWKGYLKARERRSDSYWSWAIEVFSNSKQASAGPWKWTVFSSSTSENSDRKLKPSDSILHPDLDPWVRSQAELEVFPSIKEEEEALIGRPRRSSLNH